MKTVSIKRSGTVEEMPIEEFSKWMCLVEAFYYLENKAEELSVSLDKMIQVGAINQYIKERYPAMLADVRFEVENGIL